MYFLNVHFHTYRKRFYLNHYNFLNFYYVYHIGNTIILIK